MHDAISLSLIPAGDSGICFPYSKIHSMKVPDMLWGTFPKDSVALSSLRERVPSQWKRVTLRRCNAHVVPVGFIGDQCCSPALSESRSVRTFYVAS
ncbi:hypothetical protein SKAU_G00151120 [Synaphobranchus kaupii]|uniref:Uncharacterized protein n=1 Tax=Synaphobranchus kaupii TaxID=118154 RepID=A0A9Q1FH36_SYNKA|nr:hypothetical protein SKAU_G00151120 [Synaphobranchus kaupii]